MLLCVSTLWTATKRVVRERKWALVPMLLHLIAVTAICLTVANVQIITRMVLSNSPLFVWHVAALLQRGGVSMKKALLVYWLGYFCVGTAAFSLFLPWT